MGVVRRDVVLLGVAIAQKRPGLEEELDHSDIGRQRIVPAVRHIVEPGDAVVEAFRQRPGEATLQPLAARRRVEGQGRLDGQVDLRVAQRPAVERIGDMVRLAEAERQRQDDRLADRRDHRVGQRIGLGEALRHQLFRRCQPSSGAKRGPCLSASSVIRATISSTPRCFV